MTSNTRARAAPPVHPLASMLREAINDRGFVDTDGDIHYCQALTADEIEMVISKYEKQHNPPASPGALDIEKLKEYLIHRGTEFQKKNNYDASFECLYAVTVINQGWYWDDKGKKICLRQQKPAALDELLIRVESVIGEASDNGDYVVQACFDDVKNWIEQLRQQQPQEHQR